jgi:ribonuclease P protein component
MERAEQRPNVPAPNAPPYPEQDGRLERRDDGHDERFQRAHRLRSSVDFARTRQQGRRLNSAHLTLIYARRTPVLVGASGGADAGTPDVAPLPTRIGFAISKRVGDAVRRNLVKRRLREHIRRALWKIAPGWDMIIGARPGAAQADSATLGAETRDLLTRGRLMVAPRQQEPYRS